jgi:hypothetical protein
MDPLPIASLTQREIEVLHLLDARLSSSEIAKVLDISFRVPSTKLRPPTLPSDFVPRPRVQYELTRRTKLAPRTIVNAYRGPGVSLRTWSMIAKALDVELVDLIPDADAGCGGG